ncbi:HAMP domain-containing protein [Agrobacterium tumefaciens]|uniref:methyl-accepting chemotaxis protein n=1 Tax=Agrobacterium tumefaciens complex TaxID=1183400 RepID=UPI0015742826|nr:methyl-accepting chemotaxis protein [Agrobacterium fabrum]NSZ09701.1 HAMP domain-containing protein [Agrobacterium tumefaciens]
MKNLKISVQLFGMVAVLMTAFAFVTIYQVRTSINALYDERYEMLRTQVDSAISVLQSFHDRERDGEFSTEDAQKLAYATVSNLRYEPAGYIFGLDFDAVTRMHYDLKQVGSGGRGHPDKMGNLFREEIVAKGRAGGGVTSYFWGKPGQDADQLFEKAVYSRVFAPWGIIVATGVYIDDLNSQIRSTVVAVIAAWLVAFVVAMAVAWFVIRNITVPLAAVHSSLQAVADEDVDVVVPYAEMSNEVGLMAKSIKVLQEKIRERHAIAARAEAQGEQLNRERQQNLDMRELEATMHAQAVRAIGISLEELAKGNLVVRCKDLGLNYELLRQNFNDALDQLQAAMVKVNAKSIDIGNSKEDIRRASNELSQRTEHQAANLEETSAALDELTATVRQTVLGAQEASSRVTSITSEASRSDAIVVQAIEAMGDIENSSKEISEIIGVIDEIAFQTNLLALNAGVEAARAGESGKGFAVVAQEVRELAQRSAAAAKEIKDRIARSSEQVHTGVQFVGEAGDALKRISLQVQAANEIVDKIALSASEQHTTLRAISSSLNQLDAVTQRNAAMAEETTASAEALAQDTEELISLIRVFKIEPAMGTESIISTVEDLRRAS